MALNRLYFITGEEEPLEQVREACEAGVRLIQLRMKKASDKDFVETATEAMKICDQWGSMLIINDRVTVAAAVGAHGVHLGKEDMPVRTARHLLGKDKIVGGTANTLEDIREHYKGGADYIGLGPYRYTATKAKLSPILGLEGYRQVIRSLAEEGISIPIYGIGGIEAADVGPLLESGLYGVAFSGLLVNAKDRPEVMRGLEETMNFTKTI